MFSFFISVLRSEAKKEQQKRLFGATAELKIFLLQNTYFIYAHIKDFQNFQISTHSDSIYILKSVHLYDTHVDLCEQELHILSTAEKFAQF